MEGVVAPEERKHRSKLLRGLSLERYKTEALKQVGQYKKSLVLKSKSGQAQALSRDYWNIDLIGDVVKPEEHAQEVNIKIMGFDHSVDLEGPLLGELVYAVH